MKRRSFRSLKLHKVDNLQGVSCAFMKNSYFIDKSNNQTEGKISVFQLTQLVLCILNIQRKIHENSLRKGFNELINEYSDQKAARVDYLISRKRNFSIISLQGYLLLKDKYKDPYFLELEMKYTLNGIKQEVRTYSPQLQPFIFAKKFLSFQMLLLSNSKIFNALVSSLILIYCILLESPNNQNILAVFRYCFIFELIVRISGNGLFFDENAYFKSFWNLFDFLMIASTQIFYFKDYGLDVIPFRLFKFLKLIKINELQNLLASMFSSSWLLRETFLIVLVIMLFFSMIGTLAFAGSFQHYCFNPASGFFSSESCGNAKCYEGLICVPKFYNMRLEQAYTSFDNLVFSFTQVLRVITLCDWAALMNIAQISLSNYVWIYFFFLVLVGNLFISDLVLSVIKVNYSHQREGIKLRGNNKFRVYNLKLTRDKTTGHVITTYRPSNLTGKHRLRLRVPKKIQNDESSIMKSSLSPTNKNRGRNESPERGFGEEMFYNLQYRRDSSISTIRRLVSLDETVQQKYRKMTKWMLAVYRRVLKNISNEIDFSNSHYFVTRVKSELGYRSLSERDVLNDSLGVKQRIELHVLKRWKDFRSKKVKMDYTEDFINILYDKKPGFVSEVISTRNKGKKPVWEKFKMMMSIKKPICLKLPFSFEKRRRTKFRGNHTLSDFVSYIKAKSNIFGGKRDSIQKKKGRLPAGSNLNYEEDNEYAVGGSYGPSSPLFKGMKKNIKQEVENEEDVTFAEEESKYHYLEILEKDVRLKKVNAANWSGVDVDHEYSLNKTRKVLYVLSYPSKYFRLQGGIKRTLGKGRYILKTFCKSNYFKISFMILVLLSIITLSLEGLIGEEDINLINFYLGGWFFLELLSKIISFGTKKFFRNNLNLLDALILIYQGMDLIFHDRFQEDFPSFRLFRVILVLRVLRITPYIPFLKYMLRVIKETLATFLYIAGILVAVIVAYTLVGMQLFKENKSKREMSSWADQQNFDSFSRAFVSVFQVITLDNWYSLFIRSSAKHNFFSYLYFFSLIFMGNFILLKFFVANMLDGFEKNFDNNKIQRKMAAKGRLLRKKSLQEKEINAKLSSKLKRASITFFEEDELEIEDEEKSRIRGSIARFRGSSSGFLLHDIPETKSLYIFSKKNIIRQWAFRIIISSYFVKITYGVILINCVKLSLDTFLDWSDKNIQGDVKLASNILDYFLNIFYAFEMILKIITFGFFMKSGSFLRHIMNWIDCLCVSAFVVIIFVNDEDIPALRAVNVLRILKPLQLAYEMKNMKIILKAFVQSLSHIHHVFYIVFSVWLIFGIIGIMLFRKRFGYCETPFAFGVGRRECGNGSWMNHPENFDNIFEALKSLFVVSTLENWIELLNIAVNSHLESKGPLQFNNQYSSYFYFIVFIFIGRFFFLDLFIGVLFSNFRSAEKEAKEHQYLTDDQIKWLESQKIIVDSEPYYFTRPSSTFRLFFYHLINTKIYKFFMKLSLYFCAIHLALYMTPSTTIDLEVLDKMSLALTAIFGFEILIKILSYGVKSYLSYGPNKLDLVVICIYISFCIVFEKEGSLTYKSRFIRLVSSFRVAALIRLMNSTEQIKNFMLNIWFILPILLNIMFIFLLVIFMFAILGCFLFEEVRVGEVVDDYVNFKNILFALMTLFKCSTADDWSKIMRDHSKFYPDCTPQQNCGSRWAPLYFLSFMLITNTLLMNMMILIIFKHFEEYFLSSFNSVKLYKLIKSFKTTWSHYCQFKSKNYLKIYNIIEFFRYLGPPLGYSKHISFLEIGKKLMKMNIFSDEKERINYNTLLYATLKDYYQEEIYDNPDTRSLVIIREYEKLFYQEMEDKIREGAAFIGVAVRQAIKNYLKKTIILPGVVETIKKRLSMKVNRRGGSNNIRFGMREVHPIYIYLLSLMAFKSWRNYIKNNERVRSMSMKINRKTSFFQRISFFKKQKANPKTQKIIEFNYEKFKDHPLTPDMSMIKEQNTKKKERTSDSRRRVSIEVISKFDEESKTEMNPPPLLNETQTALLQDVDGKKFISFEVIPTKDGADINLNATNDSGIFLPNIPIFSKNF